MIPLSMLPQTAKATTPSLPDVELAEESIVIIENIIASGINHGLNSNEIDQLLLDKVTKAELVRCIRHLLERK